MFLNTFKFFQNFLTFLKQIQGKRVNSMAQKIFECDIEFC